MVAPKMRKEDSKRPNMLLRKARLERGLSQQEVADLIGVPQMFMISRWENGATVPSAIYRERLCTLFGKGNAELGFTEAVLSIVPNVLDLQSPIYDPAIPLRISNRQELIGRSELLNQLKRQLCSEDSVRLLALHGLPGVGKTSLTLALTSDQEMRNYFSGGILWAGLGPHPSLLAHFNRWGLLLLLSERERGSLTNIHEWKLTLRRLLAERRMLIIIDDVWSLDDAMKCMVGGEQCTYILTTRIAEIAVHFAERHAIKVPELRQDEGVQLLSQIVPPSLVETEAETLDKIVHTVGGLPLALNLLGLYLLVESRHHQPRRIRAALQRLLQIESRFQIEYPQMNVHQALAHFTRTSLSLQSTISMSVSFLSEAAQQALYALSFFPAKPNSFSEEAAVAIANVDITVIDNLVDVGLLEVQGENRYQLHQTITDYAHLYLNEKDMVVERRMVSYWIHLAEHEGFTIERFKLFELEVENILNAFELADSCNFFDLLMRGILLYYPLLKYRGIFNYLERMLLKIREVIETQEDLSSKVKIRLYLAEIYSLYGDYWKSKENALVGLQFLGEDYKQDCKAYQALLLLLARGEMFQGNYEQAKQYARQGLSVDREESTPEETCHLLRSMGTILDFQGHTAPARVYWYQALELAKEIANPDVLIRILGSLGAGLARQELYTEAKEFLDQGLQLAQQCKYLSEISNFHLDLGDIAVIQGELDQAEFHLNQCILLARQIQLHPTLSVVLATLGELELKRGNEQKAELYLQEGLGLALQRGNNDFAGAILNIQAEALLSKKDPGGAKNKFSEALRTIPADNKLHMATAHYGLARSLLALRQRAESLEHAAASLALFEEMENSKAAEVRTWLENQAFPSNTT